MTYLKFFLIIILISCSTGNGTLTRAQRVSEAQDRYVKANPHVMRNYINGKVVKGMSPTMVVDILGHPKIIKIDKYRANTFYWTYEDDLNLTVKIKNDIVDGILLK